MNYFLLEIAPVLVVIASGIIGLIVLVLLIAAAFAYQGRALVKGVVAIVAWLAISLPLFTWFIGFIFYYGIAGGMPISLVVGWIAATFAYGYVGVRLRAWVRREYTN